MNDEDAGVESCDEIRVAARQGEKQGIPKTDWETQIPDSCGARCPMGRGAGTSSVENNRWAERAACGQGKEAHILFSLWLLGMMIALHSPFRENKRLHFPRRKGLANQRGIDPGY